MAEIRDARDAENFLIKDDTSSAIRSIIIVETTTTSWLESANSVIKFVL